ncbi:hypothetical protein L1785_12165 [Antribacter sp. KLBMP9083]|uniref:Uncharacterized protein n=1 Tax=Antribacter soli TaxID=2910976 RepID=A0AA41U763_9MICO|nr:hypothetical protein [Antribacter soli]MCF4121738.1 hypothetical protein [Antribacter soli]
MTDDGAPAQAAVPIRVGLGWAMAGLVLLLVAASQTLAWVSFLLGVLPSWLWWLLEHGGSNGMLPENLGSVTGRALAWLAGVVVTLVAVARVARRRAARDRKVVAALGVAALLGLAPVLALTAPHGVGLTHNDTLRDFHTLRPALDEVAALVERGDLFGWYADLPASLEFVSVTGAVEVSSARDATSAMGVVVPQWAALVDDAGGYIYSPGGPPVGWDMYSLACEDPEPLEDGWWACAMRPVSP